MTQYLIDFKDDTTDAQISTYLDENQCTVLKAFDKLSKVYHVESNTVPPLTSIVELVQNDDESDLKLLEATPIYQFPPVEGSVTITHADEVNWWKIYSYTEIDLADDTTPVPIFGAGTNIYLVDSGIDMAHPEFTGKDVTLLHSIIPNDFNDYKGHGTALASVMIGNTCGISNASLKVVKIFNDGSTPIKQSDVLYAFNAILNDFEGSKNVFSVVNLSWSISKNEYIENKIREMINAGLMVVVSAGNSGLPIDQVTPASMPEVITVGAYQENFEPCNFSNYTDPTITSLTQGEVNTGALDTWAPGDKIYAAKITSQGGGYGFTAGTSIAAAIESASLAFNLAQEIYADMDPADAPDSGLLDIRHAINYSRTGLLDLSNPKYINSKNRICSFQHLETQEKTSYLYTNKNYEPFKSTKVQIIGVNKKFSEKIGNALFNKYELKNPLPDFVTVVGHWLVITPTAEPAGGPNTLEKHEVVITLYPEDTTVDPIDWTIAIFVTGSAYNIEEQISTETDPILTDFTLNMCYEGCCTEPSYNGCNLIIPSQCYYNTNACFGSYNKFGQITACGC